MIFVPGGGTRANFVREMDKEFGLGDELAHWMAIYAMDRNGTEACEKITRLHCVRNIKSLKERLKAQNLEEMLFFLPYEWMRHEDALPHSWDVTSDSIAIYLAHNLGLKECFLIKNIDGVFIKSGEEDIIKRDFSSKEFLYFVNNEMLSSITTRKNCLKSSKPLDHYATTLIDKYGISCILINGSCLNTRILSYFNSDNPQEKYYTRFHPVLLSKKSDP